MLKRYSVYDRPKHNDICVAMCFFRPVGYQKPIDNILTVIETFDKAAIPVFVIELLYANQQPIISNSYVVNSTTVLFAKENLWNIIEKRIPENYDKIIFMDADVIYSKPSWLNDSSQLLEDNDVIQCMEWSYKDINSISEQVMVDPDPTKNRISFAKAIKHQLDIDLMKHHMGFCVGIRRDFFHKIGGFFEYALTGYGDTLFWACFTKDFYPGRQHYVDFFPEINEKYLIYRRDLSRHYSYPNRVGYVEDCLAMHLYHGTVANRRYTNRQHYIPSAYEFYHNKHGVLEMRSFDADKKDLTQYWLDRKEDE